MKNDKSINPRLLLFHCDGTKFELNSYGSLVFDSKILNDELYHLFEKEKRGNELKQMNSNEENTHKRSADENQNNSVSSKISDFGGEINETFWNKNIEAENKNFFMIPEINLRKRKNKSARQREQKKLKLVEKQDLSI